MDNVAKEIWCEALRSTEFVQGYGELKRRNMFAEKEDELYAFCCLGVLQEIFPGVAQVNDSKDWLNKKARKLLKMKGSEMDELMDMNDEGIPFLEIAEWIEENL